MIETVAEVLHENQWHACFLAKSPVGEADAFRLQELCRRCHVRVRHFLASLGSKIGRHGLKNRRSRRLGWAANCSGGAVLRRYTSAALA
jgi:hypothetical protein